MEEAEQKFAPAYSVTYHIVQPIEKLRETTSVADVPQRGYSRLSVNTGQSNEHF